jgi:hypothetical protein
MYDILHTHIGIRILTPLHWVSNDFGEESPDSKMQGMGRKPRAAMPGVLISKDIGNKSGINRTRESQRQIVTLQPDGYGRRVKRDNPTRCNRRPVRYNHAFGRTKAYGHLTSFITNDCGIWNASV